MENSDLTPHASVLSRSALHAYITGPVSTSPLPKSNFNPYRKRAGLLSFVSLEAAEEALQLGVEEDEQRAKSFEPLALPESSHPLTGATAAT